MKRSCALVCLWAVLFCGSSFAGSVLVSNDSRDFTAGTLDGTDAGPSGLKLSKGLVPNSGFESSGAAWTVAANGVWDPAVRHSGSASAKIENSQTVTYNNWEQIITLTAGHTYSSSIWIKTGQMASGAYATYFFHYLDVTGTIIVGQSWASNISASNQDWTKLTISFSLPANCPKVRMGLCLYQPSALGSNCWFDDAYIEDVTQSVYMSQGSFTSQIIDCGEKVTFGNISWGADVPSGCSVTLNTRTSQNGSAWGAWSDTYTAGDTFVRSAAARYIQYRAMLYSSSSSWTPTLNSVKIASPVSGISSSASVLRSGDNVSFNIDFGMPMDVTSSCTIYIVPETGINTQVISTLPTGWTSDSFFVSDPLVVLGFTNGYSTVRISGAKILGGQEVFAYFPTFILVDSENYGPKDRLAFFPDPFSPNGDGRADDAVIMFVVSPSNKVSLKIYSIKGKLERTLLDGEDKSGSVTVMWDGRDDLGSMCPVGLYVFQLKAGAVVRSGSVVLSK